MWTHEPSGYDCPFCRLARGVETERNRLADIVWRDELTMAFVAPKWWPRNHGHVIVVPLAHVENIYAIDDDLLGAVYATVRRVAVALKNAYGCDGTSTRQHHEPAGTRMSGICMCTSSRATRATSCTSATKSSTGRRRRSALRTRSASRGV